MPSGSAACSLIDEFHSLVAYKTPALIVFTFFMFFARSSPLFSPFIDVKSPWSNNYSENAGGILCDVVNTMQFCGGFHALTKLDANFQQYSWNTQ